MGIYNGIIITIMTAIDIPGASFDHYFGFILAYLHSAKALVLVVLPYFLASLAVILFQGLAQSCTAALSRNS